MYIFRSIGNNVISAHLKSYYTNSRFITEHDQWPPDQPKFFTPLVLVYQEDKQNYSCDSASTMRRDKYIFYTRRKGLEDIFSQLEKPIKSGKPRTILIEGAPGIGKSVLLKQISFLWASNELLKKCNFLFLLHLRDPAVQQMKSIDCLINHFYMHGEGDNQTVIAQLLQDQGRSVIILLDGYDELPPNLQNNGFIYDILRHKVFPAGATVISSRPHASSQLRYNVTCRVEILGFSEEDQAHFIQQSLAEQKEKISELFDYLKIHPNIARLCFVPFNMTILLFIYKIEEILPSRSVQLYKCFICLTIRRYLAKLGIDLQEEITDLDTLPQPYAGMILQLSSFAFKALNKNQLIFSLTEIKEDCPTIAENPNAFGLLQVVEYVRLTSKTCSLNFIHFSLQEYLAAYYVASLSPNEEFSVLEKHFWSNTHYNMFNIYVALTKGQHSSFKEFLRSGKYLEHNYLTREDKLRHIRLYRIFHEAEDHAMCQIVEEKLRKHINLDLERNSLSPNNLEDLATFIAFSSCKNWHSLNLNRCFIGDYGFQLLHNNLQHSNVTIESLNLNECKLSSASDAFLSDIVLICKVKSLTISHNNTIGGTYQFMTKVLIDSSTVIESLDMSYNNYSANTWSENVSVHTITSSSCRDWHLLNLDHCRLGDYGLQSLHFSLQHSNVSIKKLYLNNNDLSSVSDTLLSEIVITCKVKSLYISGNSTIGETEQFMTKILTDPSTMINTLIMSDNKYSSHLWAVHLFSSLGKNKTVSKLQITGNNLRMHEEVYDAFWIGMSANSTLKHLYMNGNPILDNSNSQQRILEVLKNNSGLRSIMVFKQVGVTNKTLEQVNTERFQRGYGSVKGSLY